MRAFHRYGRAVYLDMMRRGLDAPSADEATEFVFNALFRRYRAGESIADVRMFAFNVTFRESARRMRERRRHL